VRKVEAADLGAISRAMAEHNKNAKIETLEVRAFFSCLVKLPRSASELCWLQLWDDLLERVFRDRPVGGYETPTDYDAGMRVYRSLGAK
jgi:hypothetical protein